MLELPGSAGRPRTSIGRCWKSPLGFNDAEYESIKAVASSCQATPLMLLTCALQVRTGLQGRLFWCCPWIKLDLESWITNNWQCQAEFASVIQDVCNCTCLTSLH